jgi:hypothetical protein
VLIVGTQGVAVIVRGNTICDRRLIAATTGVITSELDRCAAAKSGCASASRTWPPLTIRFSARKTPVDVWRMIGSMRAVGELVRCIDGSWMQRPHHARDGGADASVPRSRHESYRIVYRATCATTRRRRTGRVRAQPYRCSGKRTSVDDVGVRPLVLAERKPLLCSPASPPPPVPWLSPSWC